MNMSFSHTQTQYLNFTKTVTRRLGWKHIKIGNIYNGVNKVMGFKAGEKPIVLGQHMPISSQWQSLNRLLVDSEYGQLEVIKEGFPDWKPRDFVEFYCDSFKVEPDAEVNRIEFVYVINGIAVYESHALAMGYDYGINGANELNCHFSIFSSLQKTRAWEIGKQAAESRKL